jgi:hypothetical protein
MNAAFLLERKELRGSPVGAYPLPPARFGPADHFIKHKCSAASIVKDAGERLKKLEPLRIFSFSNTDLVA